MVKPPSPTAAPATSYNASGRQIFGLSLAAALLGLVTAAGVRLFNLAIIAIHTLTTSVESAGAWTIPLVLAAGGIVVALIMHRFSRHGSLAAMPHIIDAVAQERVQLQKRNGLVFVIASALSIGLGAPVGADTPSAMIGGHLASWLGERFHQRTEFIRVLVVAGVGAGIAATFFAQLAAVFFAFEVVLGGFGGAVFVVPVLIAVATSSLLTFYINGAPAQYAIAVSPSHWNVDLLLFLGVTLLATLAAIALVNLLPLFRTFWARVNLPFWAKTGLAGLVVGVVAIFLPSITGTGVSQMQQIFSHANIPMGALLALAIAKLVLSPWSLGGGFAGGVIGPALVIGSALGGAYGQLIRMVFPGMEATPEAFAVVAAAAMLSATFHAPLFGAMMLYELVADYRFLVPLLLASAIAYGLARPFQPGSAYTLWLPDPPGAAPSEETRPAPNEP